MDFDHRSKHNSRFHQDMLNSRKHIRYEVVGAPRNPFEAAAKRTREAEETNACVTQNPSNRQESADCAETGISDDHKNDQCLPTVIEKQFVPEMHRNENLTAGKRPRLDLESQFDELESPRSEEFDRNIDSPAQRLDEGDSNSPPTVEESSEDATSKIAGEEGYCEEVFLSTVQKFVNEVKESSNNIGELANEALASHEEAMQQSFHNTDRAESVNFERDPGIRKGMKLTENEKQYLICQGPYQPRFKKYPTNPAISKTKQNAFSPKWYEKFPYLEYSPTTDRAFCFACCLFWRRSRIYRH
ncbi:Hypothetical predicted protein [Paramuricea clavata]|uniref:Uncharacterized protein n=1 Tax=Paramuricea clavata TaxID=317549 RepID=A0A7D9JA69_PARCT|nr:Hypothetical predicted protein [Paramuricea clavata]